VFPPDRLRRFWRPPVETVTGMASVLRDHWRAAAKMRPARLFWPTPGRWLKVRHAMHVGRVNVAALSAAMPVAIPVAKPVAKPVAAPVTTLPAAADSPDKLPDPHQC
jgi:hypothetical protein